MNKQMIFSLLFIMTISARGMEPLTEQILAVNWGVKEIRQTFNALCCTNKVLGAYYMHEDIVQYIVRKVAHSNHWTDFRSAQWLGCKRLQKKMNCFCATVYDGNKQFTPDDLQNRWYFNSTMTFQQDPLLYALIRLKDLNKIKKAIESGVVINNRMSRSPFELIDELKSNPYASEQDKRDLVTIAQLLIDNKTYPFFSKQFLLKESCSV